MARLACEQLLSILLTRSPLPVCYILPRTVGARVLPRVNTRTGEKANKFKRCAVPLSQLQQLQSTKKGRHPRLQEHSLQQEALFGNDNGIMR